MHFEDFDCLLMEETLCVTALSQHEKALQTLVGSDYGLFVFYTCAALVRCTSQTALHTPVLLTSPAVLLPFVVTL